MALIAIVKRDCETCQMVAPVLAALRDKVELTIYCQDDPTFPPRTGGAQDDTALEHSWRWHIDTVPTLIHVEDGRETTRTAGWDRIGANLNI